MSASPQPAAARAIPLDRFLVRLIWLCVLPLLLLAAWLAFDGVRARQAERDREAANLAHNFATSIDQHLRARIQALQMLAVSPLGDDPRRWPELYREAQGFYETFGSHVVLADVGSPMRMLFNTRVPLGTALPDVPRPKGHAAAPTALATRQPAVGDSFQGPIAKEPLVAIAVPALRGGRVARLVLTTFETARFQQRLEALALPAGWALSLLDGRGDPIARRLPPGFDPARDAQAAERFVARSEVSPWSVVLEIPHDVHRAPLLAAAVTLGLGLLGATLIGVLGGALASRRLGRQMASLAAPAAGDAPASDIVEIAAARRRLDDTAGSLRQSEAQFQAIFDGMLDAVVVADTERRIRLVNPAFTRLFGYAAAEVAGRSTEFLYADPADYAEQGRLRYHAGAQGDAGTYEMRYRRKDGSDFWAESGGTRILAPDGTVLGLMGMHRDITARKEAERAAAANGAAEIERQQLARLAALNQMEDALAARKAAEAAQAEILRLNADLERRVEERTAELSAANRELDAFAYAVSHDLRAPLRAMNGFAQALLEDYGERLDGTAGTYLDQIGIASRKMGELIDGILLLSRSTRGELRRDEVDVTALATRLLDELARSEPARTVARDVEPGLTVSGDARMVEAVLANLLGNAWKYTANSATPAIHVRRGTFGGQTGICVSDNGAGFDMAHAGRLFQPFQRLHRQDEFPGIGIGLATVQRIIHRHGGDIAASGEPGKGACFCFTLPPGGKETTT